MTEVTHPLFLQILPHLLELAEVLQAQEDTGHSDAGSTDGK